MAPFPDLTGAEMGILKACVLFLRALLVPKSRLAIENLALRRQVAELKQSVKRSKLRPRDRDDIYGDYFSKRVEGMGIEEVPIAPRSPWQNPYGERIIGSIRRGCRDHMIVLNERRLHRIRNDCFNCCHSCRPHLSLDRNAPTPREMEPACQSEVISMPHVGGLHHRCTRAA